MLPGLRKLRSERDERLGTLRSFADQCNWEVLGLGHDLSTRYPVPPLLGAWSGQADLAVVGQWAGWPALLASVLLRHAESHRIPGRRPHRDEALLLAALDVGPQRTQFVASHHPVRGLELVGLRGGDAVDERSVRAVRLVAVDGSLRPGDAIALAEVELVHLGAWGSPAIGDLRRRMTLLQRVAEAMGVTPAST